MYVSTYLGDRDVSNQCGQQPCTWPTQWMLYTEHLCHGSPPPDGDELDSTYVSPSIAISVPVVNIAPVETCQERKFMGCRAMLVRWQRLIHAYIRQNCTFKVPYTTRDMPEVVNFSILCYVAHCRGFRAILPPSPVATLPENVVRPLIANVGVDGAYMAPE